MAEPQSIDPIPPLIDQLTGRGSWCGLFTPALTMLEIGEVREDFRSGAEYSREEMVRAFEHRDQGDILKRSVGCIGGMGQNRVAAV